MDITCDSCGSRFKIPDDKLPAGKTAAFPCPKCRNRIIVPPQEKSPVQAADGDGPAAVFGFEEEVDEEGGAFAADDRPFDFIEEEGKIALVCESDDAVNRRITEVLELLEYHVVSAADHRDALRKIRYQDFDAVVVNERFSTANPDTNGVLIYLERLPMPTRRGIFVAMISDRFPSMDHMMAFNKSVNVIVNRKDMADIDKILSRSISSWEMFYRIFKESLP